MSARTRSKPRSARPPAGTLNDMAASLFIEEGSGTFTGPHPHNGYYAGDFSAAERNVDQAPAVLELPLKLPLGFGAVGLAA